MPTQKIMKQNPSVMPIKCGIERFIPKLTPEVKIIKLFGPGVPDDTAAKTDRASNWSVVMPHHPA
jgi:hypothetical protein